IQMVMDQIAQLNQRMLDQTTQLNKRMLDQTTQLNKQMLDQTTQLNKQMAFLHSENSEAIAASEERMKRYMDESVSASEERTKHHFDLVAENLISDFKGAKKDQIENHEDK